MSYHTSLTLETTSAQETEQLGIRLACALSGGTLITLAGELGAGKTVLVRGIACGLNVPPGVVVTSPTYVLQHIYRGGRLTLYHIDIYRVVGGAEELDASGLADCLSDAHGVVCLEWSERVADYSWPADHLNVRIEHLEPSRRRMTVTATGPRAAEVVKQLSNHKH
ncbi:MAG TPA: tRNA (adenosine(37)-N6)-threonylcarbamoyltransferase complex ATPase subunit type 1 TsaE [Planctomycetota bacterium]|jgi:tRNA threonylcarbamoyladenosine biosynthesis protein TsaE